MVNVFSSMSVPQLSGLARRTALVAAGMGVIALVASFALGYDLFGLGVCLGILMALGNFRLIVRATAKASALANAGARRPLVMNTLGRLGLISVVALVLAWLVRPFGFGAIVGLALFQFTLLANSLVTLLRDPSMQGHGGGEQ